MQLIFVEKGHLISMDIKNPKIPENRCLIQGIEDAIFNSMDTTSNENFSGERKFYGDSREIEEIDNGDEFNLFSTMDSSERGFNFFKNFDIIHEPPDDHHFFKYQKDSSRVHALGQKIKPEWNLLKEKLPNSIFVRVYESRVDLMRVAIISPPDTRYHYGLFFFDIFFPRKYPFNPPKIYYRSYGFDLNPNLRPRGKVRLSMLKTGYRRIINELCACTRTQWNPKQSSILHVLYAIQGVIKCAKPYSIDESEPSKYIKKAFQLTCRIMIRVLQEPPKNFEDFVKEHFRKRADSILVKFRQEFGGIKDQPVIIDLFTDLYKCLERNGTSCVDHLCFLKSRKENDVVEESKNEGHLTKIARRLKNLID